jgi:hypothetical protein
MMKQRQQNLSYSRSCWGGAFVREFAIISIAGIARLAILVLGGIPPIYTNPA